MTHQSGWGQALLARALVALGLSLTLGSMAIAAEREEVCVKYQKESVVSQFEIGAFQAHKDKRHLMVAFAD